MKQIFKQLKSKMPSRQMLLRTLAVFLVISFFTTYLGIAISKQNTLLPNNPLDETVNSHSQVHLMSDHQDLIHAEEMKDEEEDKEEKEDKEVENEDEKNKKEKKVEKENEQDKKEDKEVEKENKQDEDAAKEEEEKEQQDDKKEENKDIKDQDNDDSDNTGDGDGDQEGSGEGDNDIDAPDIEITGDEPENDQKVNNYFTTSIKDGETVTEEKYSFNIEQLEHDYDIRDVHVNINPKIGEITNITDDYNKPVFVDSVLSEGENEIKVGVTYLDDDKEGTFTVTKTYIVNFKKDTIHIQSDLKDNHVVYRYTLIFYASAKLGSDEAPVKVTLNSDEIEKNKRKQYKVELTEGKNKIVIESEYKGKQAKKEFTINYQKPQLDIETSLKDQTVDEAAFTFSAKAFDDNQRIGLAIEHNNKIIKENDEGKYTVTLSEGKNKFELTAAKSGVSHNETYEVIYNPKANGGEEEEDEDNKYAPTIEVPDLEDGQTLRSSSYTFHVHSNTYKGDPVTAVNGTVSAQNNGRPIKVNWVDGAQISFTMDVESGDNNIVIEATDNEGNNAIKELTVHGDIAEEGEVIGNITISVEASTVGLGYLIGPEQVDIIQGDNGVSVIDRLFTEHGFEYDHTGTSDNSFYLEAIYKKNLVTDPVIPSDLAELAKEDMERFDPEDYLTDSLGEFDFTNGSGWMYSVNGNYPNVGFADWHFKDGDEVRIRFTLTYGADIGGGIPGTNYKKEW